MHHEKTRSMITPVSYLNTNYVTMEKQTVNHEPLSASFNFNRTTLSDADFYVNPLLSNVNVYQTDILTFDDTKRDVVIADLIDRSKKFTHVQMIQEAIEYGYHITFISYCPTADFVNLLKKLVSKLESIHDVSIILFV